MKKTHVSNIKQLFYEEGAMARILEALFVAPEIEYSLAELANASSVSRSTAWRVVQNLAQEGLVEIRDLGVVWRVKANAPDAAYRRKKIVRNLGVIYQSGIMGALAETFAQARAIVLYGSFRKGEDGNGSDVDIAVELDRVGETQQCWLGEKLEKEDAGRLEEIEKRIGRKFSLTVFDRKNVDLNLFNGIANGIVLSGFLEVGK